MSRLIAVLVLAAVAVLGCSRPRPLEPAAEQAAVPAQKKYKLIPEVEGEPGTPVATVSLEESADGDLLMAFWDDGRVVWSGDDLRGGPPFRKGKIPPERIRDFLAKVRGSDYSTDPSL